MHTITEIVFCLAMLLSTCCMFFCMYKFVETFKNSDLNVSDLLEDQTSKLESYYKEAIRIQKILNDSAEDSVIIDGEKYIKVPRPALTYWEKVSTK